MLTYIILIAFFFNVVTTADVNVIEGTPLPLKITFLSPTSQTTTLPPSPSTYPIKSRTTSTTFTPNSPTSTHVMLKFSDVSTGWINLKPSSMYLKRVKISFITEPVIEIVKVETSYGKYEGDIEVEYVWKTRGGGGGIGGVLGGVVLFSIGMVGK
ncbi:hypothetical protein TrVE_jg8350 [Triparma verrucosa]|uniref:Uncharacterized protein n=1 Tax=Triparma verrucosa TaxID=1606542 RepID=A0A9W7C467_9STRA|nr:hypothetical protein TrVE_jg8350 [Triparma verrucosa]